MNFSSYTFINELIKERKYVREKSEVEYVSIIVNRLKKAINEIKIFAKINKAQMIYKTEIGIDTILKINTSNLSYELLNKIGSVNFQRSKQEIYKRNTAKILFTINDVDITSFMLSNGQIDPYYAYEYDDVDVYVQINIYNFREKDIIKEIEPLYGRKINIKLDNTCWRDIKINLYTNDKYRKIVPLLVNNIEELINKYFQNRSNGSNSPIKINHLKWLTIKNIIINLQDRE